MCDLHHGADNVLFSRSLYCSLSQVSSFAQTRLFSRKQHTAGTPQMGPLYGIIRDFLCRYSCSMEEKNTPIPLIAQNKNDIQLYTYTVSPPGNIWQFQHISIKGRFFHFDGFFPDIWRKFPGLPVRCFCFSYAMSSNFPVPEAISMISKKYKFWYDY